MPGSCLSVLVSAADLSLSAACYWPGSAMLSSPATSYSTSHANFCDLQPASLACRDLHVMSQACKAGQGLSLKAISCLGCMRYGVSATAALD